MPKIRSTDGTELVVAVTGRGPVLVLVDGAMAAMDSHPSAPCLDDAMGGGFTVVRYDR